MFVTEWTNDEVIRLMEEYQARPELWDPNHEAYRVQTVKYDTWCEMAALFKCDIVMLRKKLNSVFASHRREKARVRQGFKSNWFLYEQLKFLPSHLDDSNLPSVRSSNDRKKMIQISTSPVEHTDDEMEEEILEDNFDEDNGEEVKIEIENEIEINDEQYADKIKNKRRPTHYTPYRPAPSKQAKSTRRPFVKAYIPSIEEKPVEPKVITQRIPTEKDECDSFGEYIAMSLRKHDERTQAMIKQAINNILFEQEMKKYNNTNQFIVISGMDDNPLTLEGSDK